MTEDSGKPTREERKELGITLKGSADKNVRKASKAIKRTAAGRAQKNLRDECK